MASYFFVKTPVSVDRLKIEIDASNITNTFQYANYSSPNLETVFDGSLSGSDLTTLSGIVAAHTGNPVYEPAGLVAVEMHRC